MSDEDTLCIAAIRMEAIADQLPATDKDFPEVSIIMPCLNEADTLAACIGKARRALNEQKYQEKSSLPTMEASMGALIMAIRR